MGSNSFARRKLSKKTAHKQKPNNFRNKSPANGHQFGAASTPAASRQALWTVE
jgi:hypothetical protein